MPIVDFEQDPSKPVGTGNFRDDKGRVMYLTDPDTANRFIKTMPGVDLKSQVAAESNAIATQQVGAPPVAPDARTAMNAVSEGEAIGAAPPTATDAPAPPMSVAGAQQTARDLGITDLAIKAPGAPPPAAAPAAPPSRAKALVSKLDQLPVSATSSSSSKSVVQGRDAGNVQRQIGEETQAGEALDKTMLDSATGKDARADQGFRSQQTGLQQQSARDVQAGFDAKAQAAQAAQEVDRLRGELEANDKSLDPDRVMKNMSTGKRIGMVILAALSGGFAAMSGQKGNPVLDVIDAQIEADIERQKAEIASGRVRIGNHMNEFLKKGYDAETAEKLARDRLDGAVAGMAELESKRVGAQGANAEQAQMLIAQRGEQRAARRGELLAQTEDRVQTQSSSTTQREAPKGIAGKTPEEPLEAAIKLDKALEEQGYTREQRAAALAAGGYSPPGGKTAAELAREAKGKEAGDGKFTAEEAKAQAAHDTVSSFGTEAGLVRDPASGKWAVGDGIVPPGFVESVNPFSAKPIESKLNAAVEAYGRLMSGGVIGDDEREAFKDQLGANTRNREQLAARLNAAEETLKARRPPAEREKGTAAPKDWK